MLSCCSRLLPRRHAFGALLAASTCTTGGDAIEVGTLNFYSIRIVIMFALIRVIVRGELKGARFQAFDALFLAWLMLTSLLYVAVDGRYVNFSERLGYLFDAGGLYIAARILIRNVDDLAETVAVLALLLIPLAVLMGFERITGRNLFAALGGVTELSQVRNGTVRCQGPFSHPILAGSFGAAAFALLVGLSVFRPRSRALAVVAALSAAFVVYASGSSGPFSALIVSVIGLGMWWIRTQMRVVRWAMLSGLIMLALVMKAPVWFVIDRLSDLIGGDGWYRSQLIDSAINHFSEWWLIGTGYTAHWMESGIPANPYSADIVNEFVGQGIRGGLVCLVLFLSRSCRGRSLCGDGNRCECDIDTAAPALLLLDGGLLAGRPRCLLLFRHLLRPDDLCVLPGHRQQGDGGDAGQQPRSGDAGSGTDRTSTAIPEMA